MTVSAKTSLRWELICDGAVRKYPDGREVCCSNGKGLREYQRRTAAMVDRQDGYCAGCGQPMSVREATFEHCDLRGAGGSRRDDRIVDDDRKPMNLAMHLWCNSQKGSRR